MRTFIAITIAVLINTNLFSGIHHTNLSLTLNKAAHKFVQNQPNFPAENLDEKKQITVTGYVKDGTNSEMLFGANIYDHTSAKGAITDLNGFYSITIPSGLTQLQFSFIGLKARHLKIYLQRDTAINISLTSSVELKELQVFANETASIQTNAQMSSIDVSMDKINSLPALMGEKDIIKAIQLMPGVQSASQGSSSLYVRGGGPDQNLVLLDGVPIYHASHLFGFSSVFNTDVVSDAKLIKGGFSARYGGRLSSVIDVGLREGNNEKLKGTGTIGLISSKITLDGPIIKDKTTLLISGRRTYIDLLTKPFSKAIHKALGEEELGQYYFYDFSAKIKHQLSKNDHFYLSAYMGHDQFGFTEQDRYEKKQRTQLFDLQWGNAVGSLGWKHIFNPKLVTNLALNYSRYNYASNSQARVTHLNKGTKELQSGYASGIQDWIGKWDMSYYPSGNHEIKFGISDTYHHFLPGTISYKFYTSNQLVDTTFKQNEQYSNELSVFMEDEVSVGTRLRGNIGVNATQFTVEDTNYYAIEPRFTGRFLLSEKTAVKASYSYMTQSLHLLSNPTVGLPTDLWVSSSKKIAPQNAHQIGFGITGTLSDLFEWSVEGYYKYMKNLIDYKDGTSFLKSNWQQKVDIGKGWSYGAELLLEKKIGNTTGWIGYTLSWTERQFDNINSGKKYPYTYDRRHDVGMALAHKINDNIDFGVTWAYGTGRAITKGYEKYLLPTNKPIPSFSQDEVTHYEGKNNDREPANHRLDFGINFRKEKKWGERTWNISVYNVYNKQNPFFSYHKKDLSTDKVKTYELSILPIMPSISYSFKF